MTPGSGRSRKRSGTGHRTSGAKSGGLGVHTTNLSRPSRLGPRDADPLPSTYSHRPSGGGGVKLVWVRREVLVSPGPCTGRGDHSTTRRGSRTGHDTHHWHPTDHWHPSDFTRDSLEKDRTGGPNDLPCRLLRCCHLCEDRRFSRTRPEDTAWDRVDLLDVGDHPRRARSTSGRRRCDRHPGVASDCGGWGTTGSWERRCGRHPGVGTDYRGRGVRSFRVVGT